jgi:putative ABC transport system permease protein
MIASFRMTVDHWISQTVAADLVVASSAWLHDDQGGAASNRLPGSWRDKLGGVRGVAAVDVYRQIRVEIDGRPATIVARDLLVHAARSRYLLVGGDARVVLPAAVEREGVLVAEVLANRMGWHAGAHIQLPTPEGPRAFPVVGVFYDYATDGGKVVMDVSLYRQVWQDQDATVYPVYLQADADAGAVQRAILNALGPESDAVIIRNAELKAEIMHIFDRTFSVTRALEWITVLIAVLGIMNALFISVLERRRELATLRAMGASRRQVERVVLWESAYIGTVGGLTGIAGGLCLSLLLVKVVNRQSFGWTILWEPSGDLLVRAAGIALAAALLAGLIPAWMAGMQSVAAGVRYE